MQVQIAVPGTFHAFKLGRQLEKRDVLRRIYSMQPSFMMGDVGIPADKISHIHHPHLFLQLGNHVPVLNELVPSRWNVPLSRWASMLFDRSVSGNLEPAEDGIFLGFAGNTLRSLRRANDIGLTTVVERSSVHIRRQKQILDDEYQHYDQGKSPISENHVLREEKEYDVADYIVTPSTFVVESFIEQGYSEEKLICTPIGIDVDAYDIGHNDGPVTKDTNFLFAGSVDLQKGIQYLLEAWDAVDLPEANLLIAGNISNNMKDITAEYESDNSVEFLGWADDMAGVYRRSSALVLPSVHDGFGMVVTEAMANGLPVIVSENTGVKDCVRNQTDGIVVPTRDSEVLAEALKQLYDDPERRREMGDKARNRIKSKYTEDDYGHRIYSEYERML